MDLSLKKHNWKHSVKELALIVGFGTLNGILMCRFCFDNLALMRDYVGVSIFIWLVMWKGNSYTSHFIDHFYSWLKDPVKRLIYGVIGHSAYTALAAIGIVYGLEF